MASTRSATGHSRPRQFTAISTEPARARKTATGAKKRGRKPAEKKTTTGRVGKKSATKPIVGDKVKGAVEKAKGVVERKPGKKGKDIPSEGKKRYLVRA